MTICQLNEIACMVKVKGLCQLVGIAYTTIKLKMNDGRELTDEKSKKLEEALSDQKDRDDWNEFAEAVLKLKPFIDRVEKDYKAGLA
jgi:hypothetical protein